MVKEYPYFYLPRNQVDVKGAATSADYNIALQVLQKDPNVNISMVYCVLQDTPQDEGIMEVLDNAQKAG